MKTASVILLATLVFVPPASHAEDAPEVAVCRFMEAIYSNNKAATEKASVPNIDVSPLIGSDPISFAELSRVSREAAHMELALVGGFTLNGRPARPDSAGKYPVGTRGRYVTSFRNTPLVVPVVSTEAGWRVDPRWWLASARQGPEPEVSPGTPEFAAKAFLIALVTHDRDRISEFVLPSADVASIFQGAPAEPDRSDHVVMLALEMPLVEISPAESYALPSGETVAGSDEPTKRKLLVGLYGSLQIPFVVQRVGSEWRVVPQSYFKLLNEH